VLDEDKQIKEFNNGKHRRNEPHDDYAKATERILSKLKYGKSISQINQEKICEIEDLEFLERQGLVEKQVIETATLSKTIWRTVG